MSLTNSWKMPDKNHPKIRWPIPLNEPAVVHWPNQMRFQLKTIKLRICPYQRQPGSLHPALHSRPIEFFARNTHKKGANNCLLVLPILLLSAYAWTPKKGIIPQVARCTPSKVRVNLYLTYKVDCTLCTAPAIQRDSTATAAVAKLLGSHPPRKGGPH